MEAQMQLGQDRPTALEAAREGIARLRTAGAHAAADALTVIVDEWVAARRLSELGERPRSHADGPATERRAATLAWPRAESSRRRIIAALERAGDRGRTFDELEVELSMFSARQRLADLKAGGWAVPNGQTRDTRRGAAAEVYVLSEAARRELAGENETPF